MEAPVKSKRAVETARALSKQTKLIIRKLCEGMNNEQIRQALAADDFGQLHGPFQRIVLTIIADVLRNNPAIWRLLAGWIARNIPENIDYAPEQNESLD